MYGKRTCGERDKKIYTEYLEGKSVAELAKEYGMSKVSMYDCIKRVSEEDARTDDPFYVFLDCNCNLYLLLHRCSIYSEAELRKFVSDGGDLMKFRGIGAKKYKIIMDILHNKEKVTKEASFKLPETKPVSDIRQRDIDILNMRESGKSYKEIANHFGLSPHWVSSICTMVKQKKRGKICNNEWDIGNVIGLTERVKDYFLVKGVNDIFKAYGLLFLNKFNLMEVPGIGPANKATTLNLIKNYICALQEQHFKDISISAKYFECKMGGKPDNVFVSGEEMLLFEMFGFSDKTGLNFVNIDDKNRPSIGMNDIISKDARSITLYLKESL